MAVQPSDFDRICVLRGLMDSNNGCAVADGLACPECFTAAGAIIAALRSVGRLGDSIGSCFDASPPRLNWMSYWHLDPKDPDVQLILPLTQECWGAENALDAARCAVASLRRFGRLDTNLVDERALVALHILQSAGALSFRDPPVKLHDGRLSRFYINVRIVTDPLQLCGLADLYADAIIQQVGLDGFDVVFGPAYAGIPLAVVTSQQLWRQHGIHRPYSTLRQETKQYGAGGRVVGAPIEGRRLAMVDDVLTGGGTKISTCNTITELGGLLVVTVVAVDRTNDVEIIPALVRATNAPVRAIADLEDLAHSRGFPNWATYEKASGC